MERILTYRQFGAKGDGVTDDFAAIVRAHEEANRTGARVEAHAEDVYYIGLVKAAAVIKTDVNWRGATFIIDDTKVSHLTDDRQADIFRVASAREPYTLPIPDGMTLRAGATSLGVAPGERCMVKVENEHKRDNLRYGVNEDHGNPRHEMLLVDADGNIDPATPVQFDYDAITSITVYPTDDTPLTVENGRFRTIANNPRLYDPEYTGAYYYYRRGILCERSHATLRHVDHTVEEEGEYGAPYTAFFFFDNAYDCELRDCKIVGRYEYKFYMPDGRINGMGSYEFNARFCIDLRFIGLVQTTDITDRARTHGVMGSFMCRNVYMENCYIDRFDAHKGLYGAVIRNCTLGFGILVIGGGTLLIENVTRLAVGGFIHLRMDYNSIFDGDIIVRNCVAKDVNCLIEGQWVPFYNGLDNRMTRSLVIDGLTVEREDFVLYRIYGESRSVALTSAVLTDAVNPLLVPQTVTVRGMNAVPPLCSEELREVFAETKLLVE